MYTTLRKIKEHAPCEDGWDVLLESLPSKFPKTKKIPLSYILKSNNFEDMMWLLANKVYPLKQLSELKGIGEKFGKYLSKSHPDEYMKEEKNKQYRHVADADICEDNCCRLQRNYLIRLIKASEKDKQYVGDFYDYLLAKSNAG